MVVGLGVASYAWLGVPHKSPANTAVQSNKPTAHSNGAASAVQPKLIIGDPAAPVTIIEYADYKCPECGKFYQTAGVDIQQNYIDTGRAKIEFRPYPLYGEDSGLALYASYCAAEQGKFAAYYNKMFEYMWQNYYKDSNYSATTQQLFSPEKLGALAGEAGLDQTSFTSCAGGKTYADAYYAAVDKAAGDEVQGTPTLIIGGKKIVGVQPYRIYRTLLDMARS